MRRAIGALILAPIFLAYVPGLVDVREVVRHRDTPVDVAARELKLLAKPSDTLLVWGYEPWLFSSTHIRSALRYPTTQYIYDSPYQYPRVGKETITGMQTSPPDWVVLTPWEYTPTWLTQPDRVEAAFMSNLHADYALSLAAGRIHDLQTPRVSFSYHLRHIEMERPQQKQSMRPYLRPQLLDDLAGPVLLEGYLYGESQV